MKRFTVFLISITMMAAGAAAAAPGEAASQDPARAPAGQVPAIMLPIYPPLMQPAAKVDFTRGAPGPGSTARAPFDAFAPAPRAGAAPPELLPGLSLPVDFNYTATSHGGVEFLPPGGTFAGKQAKISLLGTSGGSGLLAPLDGGGDLPPLKAGRAPAPRGGGLSGRAASVVWLERAGSASGSSSGGPSILVPALLADPYAGAAREWSLD